MLSLTIAVVASAVDLAFVALVLARGRLSAYAESVARLCHSPREAN